MTRVILSKPIVNIMAHVFSEDKIAHGYHCALDEYFSSLGWDMQLHIQDSALVFSLPENQATFFLLKYSQ